MPTEERRSRASAATAADFYAARGLDASPPVVSDEQLAAIRERRAELIARWAALAVGDILELAFLPEPPTSDP